MVFVLLKEFMAKCFALGIKNNGDGAMRVILLQPSQHADNALDGASGQTLAVGERRQCVERAVKVGRAVYQNQRGSGR